MMVRKNELICPQCGGMLKHYDCVKRVIITEHHNTRKVKINRLKCEKCGHVHRELPNYITPYKQYHKHIILSVLSGAITCTTYGYEDYPCEITMNQWIEYWKTHDLY